MQSLYSLGVELMKEFFKNIESCIGSIFLTITTMTVIMNVFTRYCLSFTFFWAEEIAVGCFVWTIFIGTAVSYREKALMGVEAVVKLLPKSIREVVELFTNVLLLVLNSIMFYFSYTYVVSSSKITAALEISYAYINAGIVLSFGLMTIYSVVFVVNSFKKVFSRKSTKLDVKEAF